MKTDWAYQFSAIVFTVYFLIIIIIDIVERITVISAGKYEAEVITGAKISIENGLIIPPVRKSKKPSCNVSNNK